MTNTKYSFDVYLHSNKMNKVAADVSKYSFLKHNPDINIYIENLEGHEYLLQHNNQYFFRGNNKLQWDATKHQSFFPVRFFCSETHKKLSRESKWILVCDPDIFCLSDLSAIEKYIDKAESNHKDIIAYNKLSSAMLLNTKKINWSEKNIVDDMFKLNNDFDNWMLLKDKDTFNIPKEYNSYDSIDANTKLLHVSKTEYQPWKTGIRYCKSDIHNRIKNNNNVKNKTFKRHPNRQIESIVFELFKEAYTLGHITKTDICENIKIEGLRQDIIEICGIED
tara:strand:+ start:137 stop:973 length:837 start_codon:yes stop_codon:yes gene_type:complete